jgi:hypothetical protein
MPKARLAQASDLEQLLDLFRVSEVSSIAQPPDRARRIWSQILTCKGVAVFVSDVGGQIVATCMLITAPNLLRSGRGHGFLENVVTHPEFRRQGMVAQLFSPPPMLARFASRKRMTAEGFSCFVKRCGVEIDGPRSDPNAYAPTRAAPVGCPSAVSTSAK